MNTKHRWRWLIPPLFLVLFLTIPQDAFAAWIRCRSDPVVILSNGMVLDLSASLDTSLFNVKQVDYVLHVPEGVTVVAAIHTPAWLTTVETFTTYDDSSPGVYHSETIATTHNNNVVAVTANTILISALGVHLDAGSAPGLTGQTLHVYLNVP